MSIYQECSNAHGGDLDLVMQCVVNWVETDLQWSINQSVKQDDLTDWLLIFAGSLVFFMQGGFAMICAGAVRKKNVNNTLLKNLMDACGAALGFYVLGYGLAFGKGSNDEPSFAGKSNWFLKDDINPALFFFQYAFSASTVTIVAGTLAERCKMIAYFSYSFVLIAFVYPIVAHLVWSGNGYLSTRSSDPLFDSGMVDFAGSGVVHMTGGSTALYASLILGPRRGRFYDRDGNPLTRPGLSKGSSTALQMLGTLILWFGWYGFNSGSALLLSGDRGSVAARAAITTTLSAASGSMSALFTNGFLKEQFEGEFELDIVMAMNGALSGLVAVTGGCGVIDDWASIVIGVVSGWVYILGNYAMIKLKIDDAVDAIPVHMCNGIWGVLSVGLFAAPTYLNNAGANGNHPGLFYDITDGNLLAAQLVGIVFILAWTFICMFPFFWVLDYFDLLRVHHLDEIVGLDANYSHHGTPDKLFDHDSDTSEADRLEAYRKRHEEKKRARRKKFQKSAADMIDASWGAADFGSNSDPSSNNREIKEAAPQERNGKIKEAAPHDQRP